MHQELARGVLVISSGALGVLITKTIDASKVDAGFVLPLTLKWSAAFFFCAILLVILGFHLSSYAIDKSIQAAEAFYLNNDESAFTNDVKRSRLIAHYSKLSSAVFCAGVILALLGLNYPKKTSEEQTMNDKAKDIKTNQVRNDGYPTPVMQRPADRRELIEKAYPPPAMMRPASNTSTEQSTAAANPAAIATTPPSSNSSSSQSNAAATAQQPSKSK